MLTYLHSYNSDRMVLYKKQKAALSDPLVLPSEFNANTKVFVIKETGEWFARYEDYIKRLWFYMQKNFTCEITSHSNLTFFQAMASEELEFNSLETKFPLKLREPVARYLHFNTTSRFDHLLEETYGHFKKLYFPEETVFLKNMNKITPDGTLLNNINDNLFVTEFLKTHNMQFDRNAATLFQEANGLSGDVNEIGVDLSFPWVIKERASSFDSKTRYLIYQPSSFITVDVGEEEIGRDRQAFTRHLLRSFMKLTIVKASRKNGSPWCVKEDYLKHYNLAMDWPKESLKYREEAKVAKRTKRKATSLTNSDTEDASLPPKKRGRPKLLSEAEHSLEQPKKRGRKKKGLPPMVTNDTNFKDNAINSVSDETATIANGSDNNNNHLIPPLGVFEEGTPELKTSNATPKILEESSKPYNPNIAKMKQTITADVEIPRVLSKMNDYLNDEEMTVLRTALVDEILQLSEDKSVDSFTKAELSSELSNLYEDVYVYGGDLSPSDDINRNSWIFQYSIKQFDENFDTKKFVNSKCGYSFTQILKIYKFLTDFSRVLVLQPMKFENFLSLLNNNYTAKNNSIAAMKLEFSTENYTDNQYKDEKAFVVEELFANVFRGHDISLKLKEVEENKNFNEDKKPNADSEEETYIDLSIDKNPNRFLVELICCLLRLFINSNGDWRVNVPETWNDEDDKEQDKDAAILKDLPPDHQIFIENCIDYKDISFSERLIKRQFNNGIWCFILLGIFEDSFHILPYQERIKNIISKLYVEKTTKNYYNLSKLLWENFNYNLDMNNKLDIIEVLIDLLLNFGLDIKQDLDLQMDVVNNCKSERFKINKAIKTLTKGKLSLDADVEALKLVAAPSAKVKDTLKSQLAKQEELKKATTSTEWKKKFWENKINVETSIRMRSLGQDRYGQRYWYLESTGNFDINNPHGSSLERCGKIFIQGPYKEEIPFFYDGLNHEQYCQKIKDYKFFSSGLIVNDQDIPILLPRNIWNNELNNMSLSNLDWKMLDWREHHLLSNEDWCFIDDDNSVKSLISWLHKNGTKERVLRNNLSSLFDRYLLNVNSEQNNTLLYNELLENDDFKKFIDTIKKNLESFDNLDFSLLQALSQNEGKYDALNSLLLFKEAGHNDDEIESKSSDLFSKDRSLMSLNRKLLKIEQQLEPILSTYMELEDLDVRSPAQIQELEKLGEQKDAVNNEKIEILSEIENRENELKVVASQKQVDENEALAKKENTSNEASNDLVNKLQTSSTFLKLSKVVGLINKFLQDLREDAKNEKKIFSYRNSFAIQKYGKHIYHGGIEKKETGKNKRSKNNRNNELTDLSSLKERMDRIKQELADGLKELN